MKVLIFMVMALSLSAQSSPLRNIGVSEKETCKCGCHSMFPPPVHARPCCDAASVLDTVYVKQERPKAIEAIRDTMLSIELNELRHKRKELRSYRRKWASQLNRTSFDYRDDDEEVRLKYSKSHRKMEYLNFQIHQWENSGYWKERRLSESGYYWYSNYYSRRKPDLSFEAYMKYVIAKE